MGIARDLSCDRWYMSVRTMADDAKFVNYFGNFYAQLGLKYVILTEFEGRRASKSGCGLY